MIDLHVHSTCSDGTYTPVRLVDYAREKPVLLCADRPRHGKRSGGGHGLCRAAAQAGEANVPEVIPGIELSSEYQGKDVHIVGLYIDYRDTRFQRYLRDFVASRDARNEKMCERLRQAGMDISYEKLRQTFPDSVITRAHYAKYMLEHGYVRSRAEAFERYVGDHCPYYVPREKSRLPRQYL